MGMAALPVAEEQPTEKEGLVVLLDALGTKQKAADEGWPTLLTKWVGIVRLATRQTGFSIIQFGDGGVNTSGINVIKVTPHVFGFSDTLLVAFEAAPPGGAVLAACASFLRVLFVRAMRERLPLRGAAALGKFVIQDQVCLGPAVMNAAAWYERADWAGITLTPETAEVWKEHRKNDWTSKPARAFIWNPVKVPASRSTIERSGENPPILFALSWPPYLEEQGLRREELRRITWLAFSGIYDRIDAERKMRATLDFFDETCKLADEANAEQSGTIQEYAARIRQNRARIEAAAGKDYPK